MKNSVKYAAGFAVLLFLATMGVLGQEKKTGSIVSTTVVGKPTEPQKDAIKVMRLSKLVFAGENAPSEVKINMTNDYNILSIKVMSSFWTGKVKVEIVDPKGEKQGSYILKTDDPVVTGDKTTSTEEVNGELLKKFYNPLKGTWIVRALPESATGQIQVEIGQENSPGLRSASEIIHIETVPAVKGKSSGTKK